MLLVDMLCLTHKVSDRLGLPKRHHLGTIPMYQWIHLVLADQLAYDGCRLILVSLQNATLAQSRLRLGRHYSSRRYVVPIFAAPTSQSRTASGPRSRRRGLFGYMEPRCEPLALGRHYQGLGCGVLARKFVELVGSLHLRGEPSRAWTANCT